MADGLSNRQAGWPVDRQTGKPKNIHTDRKTDRQIEKQIGNSIKGPWNLMELSLRMWQGPPNLQFRGLIRYFFLHD